MGRPLPFSAASRSLARARRYSGAMVPDQSDQSDRAGGSERREARARWRCLEPVHAVTYFASECRQHLDVVGRRGFWMGYFGARAAPLGSVGPGAVSAMFFNFHPSMVRRAIPDAWGYVPPSSILRARGLGVVDVLTRILPDVGTRALSLVPLLQRMIDGADGSGRPLFSANRDLEPAADTVEVLWQACTALREHRGDGHVAALTASGLDGCEALVLFARSEGVPARCSERAGGGRPMSGRRPGVASRVGVS